MRKEVERARVDPADVRSSSRGSLLGFFLISALALRLLVTFGYPLIHHPDESFQYLEQAHRVVTGDGLVPWEYREGIRSWLLPGALTALKWLADRVGEDPRIFTRAAWLVMSMFSLVIVFVGYQWTLRQRGAFAAALVGSLLAFSPVMLLYSPRVLTEVAATNFLFLAFYAPTALAKASIRRQYVAVGLCLGLAFVLRFQVAGAIALLGSYLCARDIRGRWLPALCSAGLVVLAGGLLDWATWSYPFQSIIHNYQMNIVEGVAARFGTTSFIDWTLNRGSGLLWFVPLVALLSYLLFEGRARNAGFLLILAGIFVPLSFVGHKEVRYFYPAMPAALVVLGAGAAQLVERTRAGPVSARATGAMVAALLLRFTYLSFRGPFEKHFQRSRPFLDAAQLLHERADLCGLAIVDMAWANTGGHVFLNRSVPFYFVSGKEDRALNARPYNYALIRPEGRNALPGFEPVRCWDDDDVFWEKDRVCVLETRRPCEGSSPELRANRRIRELGQ